MILLYKQIKKINTICADSIVGTVQAADGEAVLAVLGTSCFGLLVLDLSMPGLSGGKLIERIRAEHAQLPILVLSMHHSSSATEPSAPTKCA